MGLDKTTVPYIYSKISEVDTITLASPETLDKMILYDAPNLALRLSIP